MGTRSLTFIYEGTPGSREPLVCFYRQHDGYLEGHGKQLGEFLAGMTLVNGYGLGDKPGTLANGAGCLAAQIVAHFKNAAGIGGIYIQRFNERSDSGQEFEYRVYISPTDITIKVRDCYDSGHHLFQGTPQQLLELTAKEKENEYGTRT